MDAAAPACRASRRRCSATTRRRDRGRSDRRASPPRPSSDPWRVRPRQREGRPRRPEAEPRAQVAWRAPRASGTPNRRSVPRARTSARSHGGAVCTSSQHLDPSVRSGPPRHKRRSSARPSTISGPSSVSRTRPLFLAGHLENRSRTCESGYLAIRRHTPAGTSRRPNPARRTAEVPRCIALRFSATQLL